MKSLLSIFIPILFISSSFAKEICYSIFLEDIEGIYLKDRALIKSMNRIDFALKVAKKVRTKNGLGDSALSLKIKEKMSLVRAELYKGNFQGVSDSYSGLFRNIESATIIAEESGAVLNVAKEVYRTSKDRVKIINGSKLSQKQKRVLLQRTESFESRVKFLKEIKEELDKQYRIIGKNFDEYKALKENITSLKKSADCQGSCREAVVNLERNIGIFSERERHIYQEIIGKRSQISIGQVQNEFKATSHSLLVAKKKELIYEFAALFRDKLKDKLFMKQFFSYLSKFSLRRNSRLMRVYKAIFDKNLISNHLEGLNKISYSNGQMSGKVRLLEQELRNVERIPFLADFSRIDEPRVQHAFREISDYAKKSNPTLFSDLEKAKEIGRKIGGFNGKIPKGVFKTIGILVVTGVSINYLLFDIKEDRIDDSGADGSGTLISDDRGSLEIIEGSEEDEAVIELIRETTLELQNIPRE